MFNYLLRHNLRRLRGYLNRARHRGYLRTNKILRSAGLLFLLVLLFSGVPTADSPGVVPARGEDQDSGTVAGIEDNSREPEISTSTFKVSSDGERTYPRRIPDSPDMGALTARAALVLDGKTGATLYEKNSHEKLPPASITKVMTALVALENYHLDEAVSVPAECLTEISGQAQMGLLPGETITVESLLYGLLLNSASDAACTLSRVHQSTAEFVGLMNERASRLGLRETHFMNPIGLDEENHYSSARDILALAQEAMKNPEFRKIVGTSEMEVHDALNPPTHWHHLRSTNLLLKALPGITGVKTGRTEDAGECLVASWFYKGREIYAVILGSEDRFSEMGALFSWVRSVYSFGGSDSLGAFSQLSGMAGR